MVDTFMVDIFMVDIFIVDTSIVDTIIAACVHRVLLSAVALLIDESSRRRLRVGGRSRAWREEHGPRRLAHGPGFQASLRRR